MLQSGMRRGKTHEELKTLSAWDDKNSLKSGVFAHLAFSLDPGVGCREGAIDGQGCGGERSAGVGVHGGS